MDCPPEDLDLRRRYGLMIGLIVPRPIAWVSTVGADGTHNLAPFSFFTGVCAEPMTLAFCPSRNRHGEKKDTLRNCEDSGEFCVNVVPEALARQMVQTSYEYPPETDEAVAAGLETVPCDAIGARRVAASPAAFECKVHEIVRVSDGPSGGALVLGRVVRLHVDDAILKDGAPDQAALGLIGRLGGPEYVRLNDRFSLARPKKP